MEKQDKLIELTEIVIASNNQNKINEFSLLFPQIKLLTITDVLGENYPEVIEDGDSYLANAEKKAIQIGNACRKIVLADDSGLNVEELDGQPGIYSGRYAGEHATYKENNEKLMHELFECRKDVDAYYAEFICTLYFYNPIIDHHIVSCGICEGEIIQHPRGTNGFGYDPYFLLLNHKTMAELTNEEKNNLSHRGRAAKLMLDNIQLYYSLTKKD